MSLPRLAIFKSDRLFVNHLVLVDGSTMKPLCIRNPIRHGIVQPPDAEITCRGCKGRGWTRTLGHFSGGKTKQDSNGRFIDWEEASKLKDQESTLSPLS